METIKQYPPPVDILPIPWLAEKTAPAGPARPVVTEHLGARVVTVPGLYSVTHIIDGPERLVIVDIGSSSDIPYIEKVVRWMGKPVALIIPSHLHFDHAMGIDPAASHFGALVALGTAAWDIVTEQRRSRWPLFRSHVHFFLPWVWQGLPGFHREDIPNGFRYGFPWSRNSFSELGPALCEGEPIPHLAGWTALQTPGHTDECVSLWHEKSGFLICGDCIRNFEGGEWDPIVTNPTAYGQTMLRLQKENVNGIFFGHGPVVTGNNLISQISDKYRPDKV